MRTPALLYRKSFTQYLVIASFTGLLTACGGGGSTDESEDGFDFGGIFDPDDVDGDSIPNASDPDFDPSDLDGDGIANIDDDDVDGDGTLNEFDEDFVPGDADGDGFTDPSASAPCGSERGTDPNSSTPNWDDNCHIERSITTGQFADSLYSVGIQRVVYCAGFGDEVEFPSFSDFADGEYGPISEQATEEFQAARGLLADGIVGADTWGALRDEITRLSIGTTGDNGVAFDGYGFEDGRCAGITLFYQAVRVTNDDINLGGWTLARNPPNSAERLEFSTAEPFNRL